MTDLGVNLGIEGFDRIAVIGRGSFGSVFSARQIALDRTVAIKVFRLAADDAGFDSFSRECRAIGQLDGCAEIVTVYSTGVAPDGSPYLVMEFAPGGSLDARLRRDGPWSEGPARGLLRRIALALDSAHTAGVLHRDVKPGNILLSRQDEPLLADFGIARLVDGSRSTVQGLAGTIAYTSPELLQGDDAWAGSDVYSLGVTVYAALAGQPPFSSAGSSISKIITDILSGPSPDVDALGVSPEFASVLRKTLARDRAERYQSAAEVVAALDAMAPAPSLADTELESGDVPRASGWPAGFRTAVSPPSRPQGARGTMWPTASDYLAALQADPHPLYGVREFAAATVASTNAWGAPLAATGQNAVVVELDHPDGPLALRCFTRDPGQAAQRYRMLADFTRGHDLHYLPPSLWVDAAVPVEGQRRPAIVMPWVPGVPLDHAVEAAVDQPAFLASLADEWLALGQRLIDLGVAHGDLQCGNVLVDNEDLRLVDLDGMFIPGMSPAMAPSELGHPHFQHPRRGPAHWGPDIDAFSLVVGYLSLRALSADPGLWRFHDGENLVLSNVDFTQPGVGERWAALRASRDPEVQRLTRHLEDLCRASEPPRLADLQVGLRPPVKKAPPSPPPFAAATMPPPPPSASAHRVVVSEAPTTAGGSTAWWDEAAVAEEPVRRAAPSPPPPPVRGSSNVGVVQGPVHTVERRSVLNFLGLNAAISGVTGGVIAGVLACLLCGALWPSLDLRVRPGFMMAAIGALLTSAVAAVPDLTLKAWVRASKRAATGAITGLAAGLLGLGLFQLVAYSSIPKSAGTPPAWVVILPWAVAGTVVGLSVGIVRLSGRAAVSGFIGGALGGYVGGVLHLLSAPRLILDDLNRTVLDLDPTSPGTLAAVVAACAVVGLAIGLAERVARRAWVSVIEGPLRGRVVVVDRRPMTVGSDRGAALRVPGAAPMHVRMTADQHGIVLEAAAECVIDGHRLPGGATVRLHDGQVLAVGGTFMQLNSKETR
ncbi:protein kinase [Nocardioides sp. MH1]|uniref:protein kinase domain-containing protein n=1 Tax=Nocardioides sp. MH1 TaxID=3242490 RepID=UPI0035205068